MLIRLFMRIFLLTSAFCKAALLEDLLKHLEERNAIPYFHIILDNHYPVDKQVNRAEIMTLSQRYGCHYHDNGRDLGLHGSLNEAIKHYRIEDDDLVITCDPDDRPEPGSLDYLALVMKEDPTLAMLALNFFVIEERFKSGVLTEKQVGSFTVGYHPSIDMVNVCAYRMSFIHSIGGFKQPFNYYGGLEHALSQHFQEQGMRMGYLKDKRSDRPYLDRSHSLFFDPEYADWKRAHIAQEFSGSFEEFLNSFPPPSLQSLEITPEPHSCPL